MQETWVRSLGQEDPLEKEMATHSSGFCYIFLPGKPQGQRSLAGYRPWGQKRIGHNLVTKPNPGPQSALSSESQHYLFHWGTC